MNSTLRVETSIEDSVYRVYDDDTRDDKYTAVYLYGYGKSSGKPRGPWKCEQHGTSRGISHQPDSYDCEHIETVKAEWLKRW